MEHLEPCPRYDRAIGILGKKWNCLIIRSMLSAPKPVHRHFQLCGRSQ